MNANSDYQDYQAVVWSTVNLPLLRALWQASEGEGIPVQLGYEPTNRIDNEALMIILNSQEFRRWLDVEPVIVPAESNDNGLHPEYWRVGYVRRNDLNRDALYQTLAQRDSLLPARLLLDRQDWWVRVYKEPNPDEIPF